VGAIFVFGEFEIGNRGYKLNFELPVMNLLMRLQAPCSWTEKETQMKVDAPSYCDTLSTENDEMMLQQSFPQKRPVVPRFTVGQKGAVAMKTSATLAAFKHTASIEDQRTVRRGMVRLM